jgi:hypothetical protein
MTRRMRIRSHSCGFTSPHQIVNDIADATQVWHSILFDDNVKMILELKYQADQVQRIDHKIFNQPRFQPDRHTRRQLGRPPHDRRDLIGKKASLNARGHQSVLRTMSAIPPPSSEFATLPRALDAPPATRHPSPRPP